ncbi:LOW QUALITY PROTEIN: proline dehydrogenase 1, mitochondrial-like [Portunus trituberculatus]|uniref:LOW QUALITY PROTEIN: proline dehydrogenase 1, mitochondrial-like n=1 Tax=Portunus trituberculatus TaxID=210409 RepID=UPI001E1CC928|nr:LOW QUALITY PROTEIN: proline dehydrogenase 1, mitochondrial-like [Portunus trituberculatus]
MAPVVVGLLPRSVATCVSAQRYARLCWGLSRRPAFAVSTRLKSTPAAALVEENTTVDASPHDNNKRDSLDLTFCDHEAAFKSKTTGEVLRALLVFKLCGVEYLVKNNEQLLKLGRTILGNRLFVALMKATFYGHFVAGEDQIKIQPTLERLHSFGVKSILDYSVEEDISSETAERREMESCESKAEGSNVLERYTPQRKFADRRYQVSGARTYFYVNEAQCEKNMETFINCMDAVSDATKGTGFAAIKMTALGRPQVLMQLSEVIYRTRQYFTQVTGESGPMMFSDINTDVFEKRFREENIHTDNPAIREWLDNMTYDTKGLIHLFSWSGLIDANILLSDLFRVPNLNSGQMEPIISALTTEEEEMFKNMMRRLHTIFRYARERDVRVMVDAEQTYFQPAISRLTLEMMKKYNQEKAIVFNTYQCYLKETLNNLALDLEQSYRQKFFFGAKLVRGAYMEQERARADELGYEDPVNPSYEATTQMYHDCLEECLRRIKFNKSFGDTQKIAIMIASHNEDTVGYTVNKMREYGIHPQDRVICFGQLLGMCDHISLPLGQAGYSVYKYVPYGPVNEVLPYLSRRATENGSILVKLAKEKHLLKKELWRRITQGQVFYKPEGNYTPIGAQPH